MFFPNTYHMVSVLDSHGCCNKLPQTWLKTTDIYSFTVLEAKVWNRLHWAQISCWQGHSPSLQGLLRFQVAASIPAFVAESLQHTPSLSAPSSHHRLCVGASDLSPPVSHKDGTCVPLCTVEGLPQWSRLLLQIRNLRSLKIDCLESGKREGRGGVEPGSLTPGLSHHPVLESDGHVCTCGPCLLMSHTNHPSLCPILDTKQIQGYQDLSLSSRIYPLIWKEKA